MILVAVYYSTRRKLIIIFLSIQRFFNATIIFLTFFVTLPILKQNAIFVLFPIVTIIGIQVSLIETEFRHQYGVTCQLVIIVQQGYSTIINHNEDIKIVCLVEQFHNTLFFSTKIVNPSFKGIPHQTITICWPIIRIGRCYSSICPAILVFNRDGLAFVWETAVLYTTSIEILLKVFFQFQGNSFFIKKNRLSLFQYSNTSFEVYDFHQCGALIKLYFYFSAGNREKVTIIFNIQLRYTPTWLVHENFSFRLCFRDTKHPTRIILEHSENVFSIKVERHTLMIGKQDVNRSRIDFHNVHN